MPLNKNDIVQILKDKNIEFEIVEHNAVFTVDEMMDCELPHPDALAKNLFIRDDKKRQYYLITCPEDKKINLKDFRNKYNTRPLSFASPDDLMAKLGLTPGSVCPFGVLNNDEKDVIVFLDKDFENTLMGIHPCDNTATVFIKSSDVVSLIQEHGNQVQFVEI